MKKQSFMEFLLDFATDTGEKIRKKRQRGTRKISIKVSEGTYQKFMKYVKKEHYEVVKGSFSFEGEKALILYLYLYDN